MGIEMGMGLAVDLFVDMDMGTAMGMGTDMGAAPLVVHTQPRAPAISTFWSMCLSVPGQPAHQQPLLLAAAGLWRGKQQGVAARAERPVAAGEKPQASVSRLTSDTGLLLN